MLPGVAPANVPKWLTEVTVNGIVRAVESVSWDSEMTGDLPDQVIASGGIGGAEGVIRWAAQAAVQARPVSPWGKVAGWPPSAGDLVQVRVSDGTTWWTRFTGVIDKTTGDPTAGFQSKVMDFRDRITGAFTHEALLRHMPPYLEDGSYRSIGLDFWYPLTSALRSSGFCNVPPIEGPSALSVPLQGSVWPEAGTLRDAGGEGGTIHAGFSTTPFGYAARSFTATYTPRLAESTSTPVQITLVIPGTHSGVATVDVGYGARTIRFRVNNSRGVTAFFSPNGTSPWTTVAQVGGAGSSTEFTVVQLLVKGSAWDLRTSNGAQSTGTQSLGSGSMSTVSVTADTDARIAGVQVSHPNSSVREFASLPFTPSMRFDQSFLGSTMDMMPALRGRSIPDLVNEILEATLTAAWWDEQGVLRFRRSDLLRSTASSQTITTDMDITALSWEDSLLAVRSAVEVAWREPFTSKGRQYRIELWRAKTDVLTEGSDPLVDPVEPPAGTEWFGVDRTLRRLTGSNWGAYNDRRGSYCGVWLSNSKGDPDARSANVDITSSNMYSDSLMITTTVHSLPAGAEVNTETHPEEVALKAYLRGQSLPVVRGMGRGEWVDATYRATAGLATAQVLRHELGYWGQNFSDDFDGGVSVAQRIGDYLAGMVTSPHPTITELGLTYDPRRQVGDVYTLTSSWLGISLRILVVGLSEGHEPRGAQQSVTVRVISATSTRAVTYDDLAAAWGPGNYAGLQAAWASLNYTNMAADPLRGAPS